MPRSIFNSAAPLLLLTLLVPAACAQTAPMQPEQPKGDIAQAAQTAAQITEIAAEQAELEALLANLDKADHETATLRTTIMHVSENFITGLTETRMGTLTLRTDWDEAQQHPSGLPLRQFRVDFTQLILDKRANAVNTDYIFDGEWLAERLEDEKQFNKWQVVRPGERFDPMDKMQGSTVWLPTGQDTTKLRARFHTAMVDSNAYFADEEMGENLKSVINHADGSVQLRLIPRDTQDPTKEIRMWFDATTFLPRAQAVLDGESIQISTLFNTAQNPGDLTPKDFDTTTPPAADGWDATIRPWREGD